MRHSVPGISLLLAMAVSISFAGASLADDEPGSIMNILCTGVVGGTTACNALAPFCNVGVDPCGLGIGGAGKCDCTANPPSAPMGCYCHASL